MDSLSMLARSLVAVSLTGAVCVSTIGCSAPTDDNQTTTDEGNEVKAASTLTVFSCKSSTPVDDEYVSLAFAIKNIGDRSSIELLASNGKASKEPVTVTPEGQRIFDVNRDPRLTLGDTYVQIEGSVNRAYLATIVLHKSRGYQTGDVSINSLGKHADAFSGIDCTVTTK